MRYYDHHGKKPALKSPSPQTLTAENHWRYQRETDRFSAAFYGHVLCCLHCFPWRGKYCETGIQLRHGYFNASENSYKRILAEQIEKHV